MEVETSDYVSVINAARDEVSGMWLDEPEELQATPQSYDPAIILVLDTNVLLSHLDLLKEAVRALEAQLRVSSPSLAFVVPSVVLRELDSLKASSKPIDRHQQVGFFARAAHSFLLQQASSHVSLIRFQRRNEKHAFDLVAPTNDALILDCALFFNQLLPNRVGVLSNDQNLCIQALAEHLPAISLQKRDGFQHLLLAIHPDLPAQFGFTSVQTSSESTSTRVYAPSFDDDMNMADGQPATIPEDMSPEGLISTIGTSLSNILPESVYRNLARVQDQETTEHLLRRYPPHDRWNAATALEILEKYWSSLEHLWDTHIEQGASGHSSSASRWSSSASNGTNLVLAEDGLGLPRTQLRSFREGTLRSLAALLGSPQYKNCTSLASYLQSNPESWRPAQWSMLWVDLELLLVRGRLLECGKETTEKNPRLLAIQWLQEWKNQARRSSQMDR